MRDTPYIPQARRFVPLAGEVIELPSARRVGIAVAQGVVIFAVGAVTVIGLIVLWGPK